MSIVFYKSAYIKHYILKFINIYLTLYLKLVVIESYHFTYNLK